SVSWKRKVSSTIPPELANASALRILAPKQLKQPTIRENKKVRFAVIKDSFHSLSCLDREETRPVPLKPSNKTKCLTISTLGVLNRYFRGNPRAKERKR